MNTHSDPTNKTEQMLTRAREAARDFLRVSLDTRNRALLWLATEFQNASEQLCQASEQDFLNGASLPSALRARLNVDASKVLAIVKGLQDLAGLADPIGKVLEARELDEGMILKKISVPLGVIAVVFEARPDAMPQIASLMLKSGNAVVLKGGSEAALSLAIIKDIFVRLAKQFPELPKDWLQTVDSRDAFKEILAYDKLVDLVIPRGSNALVQEVMQHTKIPVLGHADGVCHLYIDKSANIGKAVAIALDAKVQYPAACNSIETLLIDQEVAEDFLSEFVPEARNAGIWIRGCDETQRLHPSLELAQESDWGFEFSDLILAVRIVDTLDEAIQHINKYGSHHTDAICAEDQNVINEFLMRVDSASVFANVSTRFADGYRFGLGAEVGISTSRIHARGPVGLEGLVTTKFVLVGKGQVVSDYVGPKARAFLHRDLNKV